MKKSMACAVALAATAGTALGDSDASDNDRVAELERTVHALQQEVNTLRGAEDQITEQRAEEIRELVQDVLADADTRASLLQSGMAAGYDGGFVIGSSDGAFSLKINGQIQSRFVYNYQDEASGDTNRAGFEIRRAKVKFRGHVGDPSWQYQINGAFDRNGGDFGLEEAFLSRVLGNGLTLHVGQYKTPYMREELVSSSRQLAAERSLVNEEFNQGRSAGVGLEYASDTFRVHGMVNNGRGSINTSALTEDTEFAMDARVEFLLSGDWNQFKSLTSAPGSASAMMLGFAGHYQVDEYGTASGPEVTNYGLTADLTWQNDGWNIFAALVYETYDDDVMFESDRYGIVVQGGFYMNDTWELFGRYEYGDYDTPGVEELSVITIGVNNYISKQVKWTTDVGFGLNAVDSVWATSGAGWRADAPDQDGQIVFRSQVQLVF